MNSGARSRRCGMPAIPVTQSTRRTNERVSCAGNHALRGTGADQPVEKTAALLDLGNCDELVGLVRLVDRARPDHDRRDAAFRKAAGFGTERDLGMIVAAGTGLGEADDLGARRRIETREA